ncbi:MAG: carbamoyltransferase C-terminal domain-containing protein [Candidatus Saccharibacteria bacterium]|nr:carbamoyltransferase C-terminal domain-containing protein [Candidatus Saccharibacteria bacterium]
MKNIVAFQVGHDSSIVGLSNGNLVACIEGEKNSNDRFYMAPSLDNAFDWLGRLNMIQDFSPDVISILGWYCDEDSARDKTGNYFGLDYKEIVTRSIFGKQVDFFYTTHEKSHIFMSYALSPFPQGQPVYCLTWEGVLGAYYKIDEHLNITNVDNLFSNVGLKYSFLYVLAGDVDFPSLDLAGKIMALASYATERNVDKYREAIDYLLAIDINEVNQTPEGCEDVKKELFEKFGHLVPYNKGVQSQHFKEFAWAVQERILEVFLEAAKDSEKLPLLISGGCGLNCYWNQKIKDSGIFQDVFVPPCTNDSGSAIGLAAEAQFHYTGNAKVNWDVYAGEYFLENEVDTTGFSEQVLNYGEIAQQLNAGDVIAWIQGRYEIGPRALCNRSLIAAPFTEAMLGRLNMIKNRETFRPIAPVCLEEDANKLFGINFPSPHMLYFSQVLTPNLKTITHVDNTARVQTVSRQQNQPMYELLTHFKSLTDFGVLCNTSLNFNGKGFINNSRDAFKYARERGLNGVVIGNKYFRSINPGNFMPIGLSLLPGYNKNTNAIQMQNVVVNDSPLKCSAIRCLEITDWSLYNTLTFDFSFVCAAELTDPLTIALFADNRFLHRHCVQISDEVLFANNKTNKIRFRLFNEDAAEAILRNVTNIRLVFNVKNSATAEVQISNVIFSISEN